MRQVALRPPPLAVNSSLKALSIRQQPDPATAEPSAINCRLGAWKGWHALPICSSSADGAVLGSTPVPGCGARRPRERHVAAKRLTVPAGHLCFINPATSGPSTIILQTSTDLAAASELL